jgi:hypothetical protein
MIKRNPKQEGTNLWDCKPQVGLCPNNCNQCYYNRPGAFYLPVDESIIPSPEEVGDGIVRMNCGHDSNIERSLVLETASKYKHVFFNTSIPKLNFGGPVVLTVNPKEESDFYRPIHVTGRLGDLMFVRVRTSASNLELVEYAVAKWTRIGVPVVLTFMAYYEGDVVDEVCHNAVLHNPRLVDYISAGSGKTYRDMLYKFKVRHINSYWCPTSEFMIYTLKRMKLIEERLVTMCGTPNSYYCKDCRNCETYYWQIIKYWRKKYGN